MRPALMPSIESFRCSAGRPFPRHGNTQRFHFPALVVGMLMTIAVTTAGADDFPTPINNDRDGDAPVMSAEQAASTMQLPDGFSARVFAAEPDVQNPIDMAWDARGRLWVAENYTYSDRSERFNRSLRDRVLFFVDQDGDGRSDQRHVFTDDVQMLTSVEVGLGGVWLMCPPQLLFIPDANGDGVADGPAEVILDGFEVAKQNYHNFANGLRFGPDGWLYGRCGGSCPGRIGTPGTPDEQRVALEGGIWRYHPTTSAVEVINAGTTNPWGHDWNEAGDLFFTNTVIGHLWHGIAGAHFRRPFTLDPNRHTYQLIDFHADHWHFDTGGTWQASRDGAANDFGGGHAHCGAMIYRGGKWPNIYDGKLFTLNLHGRRANVERLERIGGGYVARHEPDFMIASDPWFRGMEMSYGPDGDVYVLDWSDTGECHEHTGVHRTSGRIYQIRYDGDDSSATPNALAGSPHDLRAKSVESLVALHTSNNAWFVRQARLVLQSRQVAGTLTADDIRKIRATCRIAADSKLQARLSRTLWALRSLNDADLERLLKHSDETMRAIGVRAIADSWPIDDVMGPWHASLKESDEAFSGASTWLDRLIELAETEDSALVRLSLASTLQRLPVSLRTKLASPLTRRIQDEGDHNIPLLIWYGLMPVAEQSPDQLASLCVDSRLSTIRRNVTRRLAEDVATSPEPLTQILRGIAASDDADAVADVISGLSAAVRGVRRVDRPLGWDTFAASAKQNGLSRQIQNLDVVFGNGQALEAITDLALDGSADPAQRLSAVQTLIDSRPDNLFEVCQKLLRDPRTNVVAAKGLSTFDNPEVARMILAQYNRFRAPRRPEVVSLLVSRVSFADQLIDALESNKIPRADVTASQVRQIHSLADASLSNRIDRVWGKVRVSPIEKRRQIEALKSDFATGVLKTADARRGRFLFEKNCGTCHRLYGSGGDVGPDLTGANRSNWDYILENVIDPSAVVDKDFRMTVVLLADGRVVNGLVLDENDRTWTIQTATDKITVAADEIEEAQKTEKSAMPDGLIDAMSDQDRHDLFAYLTGPTQVPLPEQP
ncbi:Cytochrome c [Crateriforma conspicua]|nr:Cytochrome c [Crateriforma conspicua]